MFDKMSVFWFMKNLICVIKRLLDRTHNFVIIASPLGFLAILAMNLDKFRMYFRFCEDGQLRKMISSRCRLFSPIKSLICSVSNILVFEFAIQLLSSRSSVVLISSVIGRFTLMSGFVF